MKNIWRAGESQPSRRNGPIFLFIGERERDNLVVRMARFLYTTVSTSCKCACVKITRFFLSENMYTCVYACVVLSQSWRISPEKVPFFVEERGKENIVRLSRKRLICIRVACVNALIFTRCLAVISLRNLARTPAGIR